MEEEQLEIWEYVPDTLWLHVFSYLDVNNLVKCRKVCVRWSRLVMDEILWKKLFYRDFHIDRSIHKPSDNLWSEEYRRLCDDAPLHLVETLRGHTDQVLHVCCSHDSTMFATSSKDGHIVVWDATVFPIKEKHRKDMSLLSWKHPHFSQFNSSDTLLLVSGVHFGSLRTSGEIAVFNLQFGFELQCRVANKPVDTFGCWIGDNHLMSSELHWLAHFTSLSILWINRASQEPESEHIPVINQLYRLYNTNASTVRCIMVANNKTRTSEKQEKATQETVDRTRSKSTGLTIKYTPQYYAQRSREHYSSSECSDKAEDSPECDLSEQTDVGSESSESTDTDLMDRKMLIYTCGTDTYVPHKVCFKYIENVNFPKQLKPGPPIQERIAARRRQRESASDEPDWTDYEAVKYMFDEPDHCLDLLGYIVGLALSPDQRYLYINVQRWSPDCVIENPMSPPPLCEYPSMHVVDLASLKVVGSLLRTSDRYTHHGHYIFLGVSDEYVASGAENKVSYVWERHYGIPLAKFQHNLDIVNAAAFSADSHILVTACDDFCVRVYRSKREIRRLGVSSRHLSTAGCVFYRDEPSKFCDSAQNIKIHIE